MPRTFTHAPPGYCDACGRHCSQPFQVFIRCYWCFAGVFAPVDLFYLMAVDGETYAVLRQESVEPSAEALTVNLTDPPAEELLARQWTYDRRFEVAPDSSAADLPVT